MTTPISENSLARRLFLRKCAGAAAGLVALPGRSWAGAHGTGERSLAFRNLHTGEELRTVYWIDGAYQVSEMQAIARVLRDHRNDQEHLMDKGLMDLLYLLQQSVEKQGHFNVISGYRSPVTNAHLRAVSSGVAKHSLHMDGKAIDIRLPGCELNHLRDAALALKAGGVGYYPKSDFIHVDTGRVRRW